MIRRSKYLISDARRDTENAGVSNTTAGISDDAVLLSLNDAQNWIFSEIEKLNPVSFTEEVFIDVVAGTSAYAIPSDAYLDSDIVTVWYARTVGNTQYSRLQFKSAFERTTAPQRGTPSGYFVRKNQIILDPVPSNSTTAGIRLNYTRRPPRVDKRRAKVTAITISPSTAIISALTLDVTDFADYFPGETAFSSDFILVDDYFCLVGVDGAVKSRNIPISAISAITGVCTLGTHAPFSTGDITAAVGDYLVAGPWSSSHSFLPYEAEPFLLHWSKSQIFEFDGNIQESESEKVRAQAMGQSVVSGWGRLFDDIEYVPIINPNNT